jgi:talin
MIEILRQMTMTIQQINNSDNIRHLINKLTCEYNELINGTYGAIGTAITNDLSIRIKNVIKDLGLIIIELLEKLGENYSKYDLENLCQKFIEKVIFFFSNPNNPFFFRIKTSYILTILQINPRGTQACINAASTVSGIIADLVRFQYFLLSINMNFLLP